MLSKNWDNRYYYPPFMGLFDLSPRERVFHSIAIFLLGALITSYKNLYIFEQILRKEPNPEKISSWYTLPFVFLSFFLIQRIIELKPLIKLKEIEISKGGFPWRYFILDTIYDLTIMVILQIIYLFSVALFVTNIWM